MSANPHIRAIWQRKLDDQHASGLSVTAWCFQQDISPQTFYYWRKRLAQAQPTPAVPASQWLALAPAGGSGTSLSVQVGRYAIEVPTGFDPHLLADVLTVLEGR